MGTCHVPVCQSVFTSLALLHALFKEEGTAGKSCTWRQRQVDFHEFQASLLYVVRPDPVSTTQLPSSPRKRRQNFGPRRNGISNEANNERAADKGLAGGGVLSLSGLHLSSAVINTVSPHHHPWPISSMATAEGLLDSKASSGCALCPHQKGQEPRRHQGTLKT